VLYIVLALVVAAFGLLVAALTTANTLWAWASVLLSVVAAVLLVTDWLRSWRAKAARAASGVPDSPKVVTVGGSGGPRRRRDEPAEDDDVFDDDPFRDEEDFPSAPTSNLAFEPPVKMDLPGGPVDDRRFDERPYDNRPEHDERSDRDDRTVVTEAVAEPVAVDEGEPGEEPTDASDLLVVAGLNAEVRVVDEHPRYHLATCLWLANRPTIPIPVSEARQLGFTPCARCGPDSVLAARHRAAR